MNRDLAATPGAPDQVEGVIQSFELAFKMQSKVPELLDISKEPKKVLEAYGVKDGPGGSFARQCLMARRLSEAGVRLANEEPELLAPKPARKTSAAKGTVSARGTVAKATASKADASGGSGAMAVPANKATTQVGAPAVAVESLAGPEETVHAEITADVALAEDAVGLYRFQHSLAFHQRDCA